MKGEDSVRLACACRDAQLLWLFPLKLVVNIAHPIYTCVCVPQPRYRHRTPIIPAKQDYCFRKAPKSFGTYVELWEHVVHQVVGLTLGWVVFAGSGVYVWLAGNSSLLCSEWSNQQLRVGHDIVQFSSKMG